MKIANIKLPTFRWSPDWGSDLTFKLTQIINSFAYTLNQFSDGYIYPSTSVTGTYNANVGDTIILASGTFTVTLPDPAKCKNKRFTVKNIGVGVITAETVSGNIDGAATQNLAALVAIDVVSDGANYWIV